MRSFAGVLVVVEALAIVVLLWLLLDAKSELAGAGRAPVLPVGADEPWRSAAGADTRAITRGRIAEPLVSAAEGAPASRPEGLREDTSGAWSPDDPLGIVIFGRILDESGRDVDGSVWFEHDEYAGRGGSSDLRGRATDVPGFVVRGLRPGTWRVSARAEPFVPFEGQIELAPSPTRLRYDVVLKKSTLTFVKFRTPEGESLMAALRKQIEGGSMHWRTGVIAVATEQKPGARLRTTEMSGHDRHDLGAWQFASGGRPSKVDVPEGCDGYLASRVPPPFFVSAVLRDEILQTKEVATPGDTVVFTISIADVRSRLSGVRVRVVDSAKQPVPDVFISLSDRQSSGGNLKTKADGTAQIENSPPGLLILELHGKGYARVEQYVRLVPGQITDVGDVVLDPPTVIEGRLLGPDGTPVADGRVSAYFLDSIIPGQPLDYAGSGMQIESNGRFHNDWARRGRYLLVASHDSFGTRSVTVDSSSGDVRGIDITLGSGAKVFFETAPADVDCLFQLRDALGTIVSSRRLWSAGRWSLMLSPGTYTFSISDEERTVRTRSFTVGSTPMRVRLGE